ncbi:MAG: Peptidase, M23/M37 family [Rhodobacteraceae bacterium HLUCCA08]|nr:MAG: Peptidase, M23/M37 family [Rhodobacteraceae bacterium HLUCCA08]
MRLLPILLLLPLHAAARDITLGFPVDCVPGDTCHIRQFVDHDPGPGASDFACGQLTYDGHKGTDISLPTRADLAAGVAVLAAAPGTVRAVRDGMPDIVQGGPGAPDVTGRDCGNGVLIDHGDGWETQYCHLARGSVLVAPGDRVRLGQPLGDIGLSGRTEFPHLHLSVRRDGAVVDPFDPDGAITCGAVSTDTLWSDPPALAPGALLSWGFAAGVPDYDTIKAGRAAREELHSDAPLVLFAHAYGSRPGDVVVLTITGPDGAPVHAHRETLDRAQAEYFRAAGRRAPPGGWPEGSYVGTVAILRDGALIDQDSGAVAISTRRD